MKALSFWVVPILVSSTAFGYLPPVDTQGDVQLKILGFDEETVDSKGLKVHEVSVDKPVDIRVEAQNLGKEAVSGAFHVWMNDDWTVMDSQTREIELKPGEKRSFQFSAQAKDSVLQALYPVHASLAFRVGGTNVLVHPVAIFKALKAKPQTKAAGRDNPTLGKGVVRLDTGISRMVSYTYKGEAHELGRDFNGSDGKTGTHFALDRHQAGGVTKSALAIHPPWRDGTGLVFADYRMTLPAGVPCVLAFSTCIRMQTADEPPSDGTEHTVFVTADGKTEQVFTRFSDSKAWLPASVDLSKYAGKAIALRLQTGPGPKNNTTCDQCFWGDPVIRIGELPKTQDETEWAALEKVATARAEAALRNGGDTGQGAFRLNVRGEKFGAAVVTGRQGLTDGVIAFTDGTRALLYRGFGCEVDGAAVGGVESGMPVFRCETESADDGMFVTHWLSGAVEGKEIPLRARVWADHAALRVAWDMPAVERDSRGEPRFTSLSIGSCSLPVWRAYAGFGNVIEDPKDFRVGGGGFGLSTRHVGGDYTNGLSLVQACDVFPDRVECASAEKRFALVTRHDASFQFIPSAKGAFAAARAYQEQSGFKQGPGVAALLGRMCMDQWGGSYAKAAEDLHLAARYGVTDAVFVKHCWQRWGYDYRLPEIFPPNSELGTYGEFLAMRKAAAESGILFSPHDNYIDFYPDSAGYSYDQILFNADGTPQTAWYNEGRRALSYRWLPHGFRPWLDANMMAMRDAFAPDALFIDVFTAMPPIDYYDRSGNFYTRVRTAHEWGEAFNACRRILKDGAPMISEAGSDALIGDIDAGEADHFCATRWMPISEFGDSERTPWHDMATHGKMILLAGGLGPRYAAVDWIRGGDNAMHGYGSDDYLSNTVMGGRNPMCDGPFSRKTVMTYWLLHDLCANLARTSLETHEFGKTIHEQHTVFGDGSEVWVNRSTNSVWTISSKVLPSYGFYAKTPETEAGVIRVDGQRVAFAKSKDSIFVDARPPYDSIPRAKVASASTAGRYVGNGEFRVMTEWKVLDAPIGYVPFVHIVPDTQSDPILFQCGISLGRAQLDTAGKYAAEIVVKFPDSIPAGDYAIRYGLFSPKTGARLDICGIGDGDSRIRGGRLHVVKAGGAFTSGDFALETGSAQNGEVNIGRKMLSFGPILTDGAFRLVYGHRGFFGRLFRGRQDWELLPLPGSQEFKADIDLSVFGASGAKVVAVEAVDALQSGAKDPEWSQAGDMLSVSCDGASTSYRVRF